MHFAKKYHVTLVLKVHILLLVMEMKHIVLCQEIKECHLQVWGIHLLELLVAFRTRLFAKDAAILGTYLHGLCGDEVYKENYTVVASKVIDQIPQMMKTRNKID